MTSSHETIDQRMHYVKQEGQAVFKYAVRKMAEASVAAVEKAGLPTRQQFRRWINAALQCDVQTVLRIVDEIEGRALNKQFRGKDNPTNVLSFPYDKKSGELVLDIKTSSKEFGIRIN